MMMIYICQAPTIVLSDLHGLCNFILTANLQSVTFVLEVKKDAS